MSDVALYLFLSFVGWIFFSYALYCITYFDAYDQGLRDAKFTESERMFARRHGISHEQARLLLAKIHPDKRRDISTADVKIIMNALVTEKAMGNLLVSSDCQK